ncbi:Hypothetical predicted protein [Paramuricea clavata]|uniref:Uncharacterized protein n=1 Tax=Paramuricea clavata TaxID=317549 RepID=A0A6S7GSY7_PARCT|nr:Hypothetical predicted protein [Paramuricea clavata]
MAQQHRENMWRDRFMSELENDEINLQLCAVDTFSWSPETQEEILAEWNDWQHDETASPEPSYGPRIVVMDSQTIKWLVFNGKAENYPAWSTKFTAYMQTKGLYKALLGKEVAPEEITPLAGDASDEQKAEWEAKVQQRNKQIEEIEERNNTVWCHIALALDNNSLLYIRHDCLSSDGVGDGAKAWRLLQQRYSNVEKPNVVSLVRQISRLQLNENEKLSEYFIRAQELMSRLTEAGEKISETLFNALVINGLPEKYEHFIVQESFNPAADFTELRTRLQNYDDSRLQRNQAKEDGATAMYSGNTSGRNKGPSKPKGDCFVCGNPGLTAQSARKRDIYQKHAEVQGNFTPVEGIGDVPVKLHLKNGKEEEMVLRNARTLNKDDVKRTISCEDNLKEVCETCALGKQSSKPVPKETQNKSQKARELVTQIYSVHLKYLASVDPDM